jgi:hypothetical protein
MDRLTLELVPRQHGNHVVTEIGILINGQRLEVLAQEVELAPATAEGNPTLAGDYSPLALSNIRSDLRHFLGAPVARWFEDGDTVLMGCPCGEWGCWPLTARVDVEPSAVHWHGFRNGHREWDLSDLGPFDFDRGQYELALAVIPKAAR